MLADDAKRLKEHERENARLKKFVAEQALDMDRTVTGWSFGIGAKSPPSDEWLFEGPEPPKGPPGTDPAWSEWGMDCVNWS